MKNPVAVFTSIAAIAAAALGTTVYVNKTPDAPVTVAAPVEPAKTPEATAQAPSAEVPSAPIAETAAPQQTETSPAPAVEQPAAAASTTTEVAMVPVQPDSAPAGTEPAPAQLDAAPATPPQPEAAPGQTAQAEAAVKVIPSLPSFDTVRVEKTGDAIIAGRAEPDSDVTVKWNGNIVGTTKANADGSFVLIPAKALATGIGAMTIEMSKNGAVTTSEGSVFVVVKKDAPATIAKVDPVAPTQVTQAGEPVETPKDLQLTAVDYDTTGNIVFSGKASPGTVVRFYVDNAATGEGKSGADGAWSFAGTSSVTPGTHILRADAIDAAGKVVSRIELPFLREDAATVAAAQVAVMAPTAPQPVSRSVVAEQPPAAPAQAAAQPVAETQVAATPEQPPAPLVQEAPRKLVIQPGNNLWKLSREVYGKGRMYTVIFEANRDLVKNPNRIYPGQILTAPKQP